MSNGGVLADGVVRMKCLADWDFEMRPAGSLA